MGQATMTLQQERDLLFEIKEGNIDAFETLMMRYEERVFQFILKVLKSAELAEEITQDVFLKIWEGRQQLTQIDSIGAWLYTLGRNQAINALKELNARMAREEQYALDSDWLVDEEEETAGADVYRLVDHAITQMPEKCQQIFILKRDEGLSNEEIANHYQLSVHTVKNHLKKSYAIVRRSLAEHTVLLILSMLLFR